MTNVLYISQLDANLLLISVLNKKGLNILFHPSGVNIMQKCTPVTSSILQERTYFLHSSQVALKAHLELVKDLIRTKKAKYQL